MSCATEPEISLTAFSLHSILDGLRLTIRSVLVLEFSARPSLDKQSIERSFVDELACCKVDKASGRVLHPGPLGIGGSRRVADDGLERDNALDMLPTSGDKTRDFDDARDAAGEG